MKKLVLAVVLMALSLTLIHCGLSTSSNSGTESSATTSTVVTNLETVENDMMPDSLNYTQNSSASVNANKAESGGNPCAEATDLFDCQPILLQLYMNLAQNMISVVTEIISGAGTAMGNLEDGASGEVTEGATLIQYSKATGTDYSVLLSANSTPIGYVDVNNNIYTVKMDLSNMAEADTGGAVGQIQAVVTYTDANTWSIVFLLTGMACSANDVAAPERIQIQVDKANGLWAGKAMLYGPRWYGNNTCSTTPADGTSMNFYTDFVGNDTAAKASVYMMQRDKDNLDDIADFGMDAIGGSFGGGDTSAYANPFCNPAGTLDALWGNDCSSRDATVGAATYSSATNWVTPFDFYQLEISIPSTIP